MSFVTAPDLREAIAQLCRDPSRRFVGAWKKGHPSRWHPYSVINPKTGLPFTGDGAWEHIADLIEDHYAIEITELRHPPGTECYVIKEGMPNGQPDLYIKITLSRTRKSVIGRSFHISDLI